MGYPRIIFCDTHKTHKIHGHTKHTHKFNCSAVDPSDNPLNKLGIFQEYMMIWSPIREIAIEIRIEAAHHLQKLNIRPQHGNNDTNQSLEKLSWN